MGAAAAEEEEEEDDEEEEEEEDGADEDPPIAGKAAPADSSEAPRPESELSSLTSVPAPAADGGAIDEEMALKMLDSEGAREGLSGFKLVARRASAQYPQSALAAMPRPTHRPRRRQGESDAHSFRSARRIPRIRGRVLEYAGRSLTGCRLRER
jgi:hypothetical protein